MSKMKKVTAQMLDHMDEEELLEYINSLEDSIEESTETERKLDLILENILRKYQDFNDIRFLRASNIEAINGLIKTKLDIHDTINSNKKAILDLVLKKRANDSKNKTMLEVGGLEESKPMDFKALLVHLDQLNIQPVVDKKMLAEAEALVDTKGETLVITAGGEAEDGVARQA